MIASGFLRARALIVCFIILAFVRPAANAGRTEMPSGLWKIPPERFTLATGVPCLYQKNTSSPATVVGLFVVGGKAAVPAGLDGLATMSTRLLLEIPDEGKVRDLMSQATRLSYLCLEDCSVILIECLSGNLEEALRVAAKIIQDPLISGLRVGRAKELMAANGKAEEDDVVAAAHNAVMGALYGGRGYGSALYGTDSSLKAIDRKDILAFNRRLFVKSNVFFCVQSDLERDSVRRLLESSFDSLPDGRAAELPVQDAVLPEVRDVNLIKKTKQTYVGRAFALPRTDLAAMARGYILETLLGKGPGSRLWALRAEERLAYGVDADLTWTKSSGILVAYLETGRSKAGEAAEALDRALSALRAGGVTEEEMEATRTMARARLLRATEAKSPRLRMIGLFEALGPGAEALSGLPAAVDGVTREDLNAFVGEILDPARVLRVTVGPGPDGPAER
jgi:zinc protease